MSHTSCLEKKIKTGIASSARLLCARRTAWQPTKTQCPSLKTLPCAHTCWFYFSRMKSQAQKQGALRKVGSLFSLPEANPLKLLRQIFSWRKKQVEEAAPLGLPRDKTRSSLLHGNSASSHITRWGWAVASCQTYEINRKQFQNVLVLGKWRHQDKGVPVS